jgi:multidrug efflux pump
MKLVETAIRNARLTISVLLFLMLAGTMAYVSIPKEAEPDIQIPVLHLARGQRAAAAAADGNRA